MKIHTAHGHNYVYDGFGVLHQVDAKPITYDAAYLCGHVDKPNYVECSTALNHLRLGLVVATVCGMPTSICDVGYGDGSFLSTASKICRNITGIDPSGVPLPIGLRVKNVLPGTQVVTFWDSLEHIEDLDILQCIPAEYLLVSLPDVGNKDLESWRHLRPNEHLHHFCARSLTAIMKNYGWECRWIGHPEDAVRGGPNNILSAGFVHA